MGGLSDACGLDFARKRYEIIAIEFKVIPAISVLADTKVLGPCPILVNDEIVNVYQVYSSKSDTT